jgi:hypothetical protein
MPRLVVDYIARLESSTPARLAAFAAQDRAALAWLSKLELYAQVSYSHSDAHSCHMLVLGSAIYLMWLLGFVEVVSFFLPLQHVSPGLITASMDHGGLWIKAT